MDVEPGNFASEEALIEERQNKASLVMIPMFLVIAVSFVSIIFVKEELNRLKYKQSQAGE